MIRKLRLRFIALCMISLTLLLVVMMGAINLINYRSIVSQADSILEVLSANRGIFPEPGPYDNQSLPSFPHAAEIPYESRYFTVFFNTDSDIDQIELERIAAITTSQAEQMSETALSRPEDHGFIGDYRYWKISDRMGTKVFFLDCTRQLDNFTRFLWTSIGISMIGWFVVLALISVCAGRIVQPVAQAYQKQKQFITDASHEIRTPLTIISANVDLIEMDPEESQESVDEIRSQVQRLKKLTEDLTTLSRLEESVPKIRVDFPISEVVEESVRPFLALARKEEKSLDLQIEPDLFWKGNDQSIRKLVSILLENAMKYSSPKGTITVSLAKNAHSLILTVSNPIETTMEEKDLQRIFERFYRSDPSRSSSKPGYGIGLSMAKALVDQENGKIRASCPAPNIFSISITLPARRK